METAYSIRPSAGTRASVLVIDEQEVFIGALERILVTRGFQLLTANSFAEARPILQDSPPDWVISELRVQGSSLLDFMDDVGDLVPLRRLVVATIYPSVATAVTLVRKGVGGYLTKPVSEAALLEVLNISAGASKEGLVDRRVLRGPGAEPGAIPEHVRDQGRARPVAKPPAGTGGTAGAVPGTTTGTKDDLSTWPSLDRTIWEYLSQVYVSAGSMSEAARRLRLDRRSLRRMLNKYPPAR